MKLPNGFGTVYKLSGNRRRPFVVRKTMNGKQKPLGYFATHDEAPSFLLKFNHKPTGSTATFADCYVQWSARKFPTLSQSSVAAYKISFRHLKRLHDKPMSKLRYIDIKHSKTAAGVRKVPVARKVLPFVESLKARGGIGMDYEQFRRRFDAVMKIHGMHHTPHECRHTAASMLDSAGMNDTAIKMILGHARRGVTKAVYTHKSLSELRKAVDIL